MNLSGNRNITRHHGHLKWYVSAYHFFHPMKNYNQWCIITWIHFIQLYIHVALRLIIVWQQIMHSLFYWKTMILQMLLNILYIFLDLLAFNNGTRKYTVQKLYLWFFPPKYIFGHIIDTGFNVEYFTNLSNDLSGWKLMVITS